MIDKIIEIAKNHNISIIDNSACDSLNLMLLIMVVEEEFGMSFTMSQIVRMKTISDIAEVINEHTKDK